MRFTALALLLVLAACVALDQHDPARYGTVHVAFGTPLDDAGPWRADQLTELRGEMADLPALGPDFIETDEGTADVVVRPFVSGDRCAAGVGRFHMGSDYVEVDPACAPGYDALRTAMGHEIGHWLGMRHIAAPGQTCSDCDPAIATGYAMMNPSIAYDADSGDDALEIDVSTPVPTDLDLAEFRSVHP